MDRLLLAAAISLAAAPAFLAAQEAPAAAKETAGALFGTRENIGHADISPPQRVMTSGADPDHLRWFSSPARPAAAGHTRP